MIHMADVIVILVIGCLLGWAIRSIYRSRKQGKGCTGCPHSENCSRKTCNGKKDL